MVWETKLISPLWVGHDPQKLKYVNEKLNYLKLFLFFQKFSNEIKPNFKVPS